MDDTGVMIVVQRYGYPGTVLQYHLYDASRCPLNVNYTRSASGSTVLQYESKVSVMIMVRWRIDYQVLVSMPPKEQYTSNC